MISCIITDFLNQNKTKNEITLFSKIKQNKVIKFIVKSKNLNTGDSISMIQSNDKNIWKWRLLLFISHTPCLLRLIISCKRLSCNISLLKIIIEKVVRDFVQFVCSTIFILSTFCKVSNFVFLKTQIFIPSSKIRDHTLHPERTFKRIIMLGVSKDKLELQFLI